MTRRSLFAVFAVVAVIAAVAAIGAGCGSSGAETSAPDGGPADDASDGANAEGPSRCEASDTAITCPYSTATLPAVERNVLFQIPLGSAPAAGWPVAILFHGSFFGPTHDFAATKSDPYGAYYQAATVKKLLDTGYAVLAPESTAGGTTFWDTNVAPWNDAWSGSPDDQLMTAIFDAIASSTFGPLDPSRLYAAGLSSGGYMTSRMAVSYPGKFKSLAIVSASYATCIGATCVLPPTLPADHPPTIFFHGRKDSIVPISTMLAYRDALVAQGHVTNAIIDEDAGHEWIAPTPDALVAWFEASP